MPNANTLLIDAGLDEEGDEVHTRYDADDYGGIDKVVDVGVTVGSW